MIVSVDVMFGIGSPRISDEKDCCSGMIGMIGTALYGGVVACCSSNLSSTRASLETGIGTGVLLGRGCGGTGNCTRCDSCTAS